MAEAPITPAKAKNPDVELLFKKMGEKLGWFEHKDLDTAMKNLSRSGKKKSTKSRVKHKSEEADSSNKENKNGKSSRSKEQGEKVKKHKHKSRKADSQGSISSHTEDNQSTEDFKGYPLKPSKASIDLTKDRHKKKNITRVSESPLDDQKSLQESKTNESSKNNSSNRLSNEGSHFDSFPEMPSMLEDIGAPLVESTRIHSRESISFYKLGDDSGNSLDTSSFDNLRISSGDGGHRYFRKDTTLIRVRNSVGVNELKKLKQHDTSEKYFSVVCESVLGEEEEEYHSVLEESPLVKKNDENQKSECHVVEESPLTNEESIKKHKANQESPDVIGSSQSCSSLKSPAVINDSPSWESKTDMSENGSKIMMKHREHLERKDEEALRTNYRETGEGEAVEEKDSESGGSFYEVEDACAQTDLQEDEEECESESGEEGATIIENKLREMDLGKQEEKCGKLGSISEEDKTSNTSIEAKDSEIEDDDNNQHINKSPISDTCDEDKASSTIKFDLNQSESETEKNSKRRNTKKFHSVSASNSPSSNSDGSFYEVVDQCVQTEADNSQNSSQTTSCMVTPDQCKTSLNVQKRSFQTEAYNSQNSSQTTSSVVTPDSCSSKTGVYFQKSSGSVSSTPRLAELQSATYEKLRMSLKKFPATPSNAVNVMESVLKKVNLFGTKVSNSRQTTLNKSDDLTKDPKLESSGKEQCVEKPPAKVNPVNESVSDQRNATVMSPSDKERPKLNRDVSKSKSESIQNLYSFKQDNHVTSNVTSAPENHTKNDIKESATTKTKLSSTTFQTPLKTVPLETPSRRTKLSLKKIPKKSSSLSSTTSDENKELYKTGFSSPDYSCESPEKTKASSKTVPIHCNQVYKMVKDSPENKQKPLTRIPDSPPLVSDSGSGPNSNEDNPLSDDGVDGVPDSESEEEFHSINVPNEKDPKAKTDIKSSAVNTAATFDISSDEDDVFQKRKEKVKRGGNSKRTVSWQKNDESDDSLPDLNSKPDQNDRYCVTVSDTSTWRSSKTMSDSSEDDLDAFFQKMKTKKKPTKMKSSSSSDSAESDRDSMKDFIVDDSDVESESDEDIFYLKTDNSRKEKPPRVPRYMTSSEEESDEEYTDSEDEKDEEETYTLKKPRGKPPKITQETPLPKVAPRQYETPKSQVLSKPMVPSSAKPSNLNVKTTSFLSSLSENLGEYRRHPDAVNYVKQFKKYKGELTLRLMRLYNQTVFDNKLPSSLEISWNNRMLKTAGYCKYMKHHMAKVELSDKVCDSAERVRDTLIHELCHAASWVLNHKNDGHGPYWKYWARKANKSHPELPVISRCHNYAIATKYTYKCVGCGYSIGRHSKSLDTERKVCGKCHGRFEVFLTKDATSSASSSMSKTPKTPRTPNRFALFVKEKYGVYKKNKDLKHKDIMQILSQEFAAKNKLND